MSQIIVTCIALAASLVVMLQPGSAPARRVEAAAEGLGWRLGAQAWTFRDRSAFEAIETVHRLGLKYIELYPGQPLTKDSKDVKVGPDLTREQIESLKRKLKDSGVTAVNFGVVGFQNNVPQARRVFEFAKALGIETITCEPRDDAWDLVAGLADEYKINLAVHDHPKPAHYWSPDIVLAAIKGRSSRCGACADTGHWKRSGLVPVECLKKLEGHIICLHFKDIARGEDQPWGTGDCDAKGMMAELKRQGFRGVISIEYETGKGEELERNVARCIEFFDATARELVKGDKTEK